MSIRSQVLFLAIALLLLTTVIVNIADAIDKDSAFRTPEAAPVVVHDRDEHQRADLLSWNVFDAREIAPGLIQSEFRAKWVRFLDVDGSFKLIDTTLVSTSEGWCMDKAPFKACFPFRSSGMALLHDNNRFDAKDKIVITEPALDQTIKALGVADVAGVVERGDLGWGNTEYVVYKGAYPDLNADLIFWVHQGTAPTLKKYVRFNNPASITSEVRLDFNLSFSDPVQISWSKEEGVRSRWDKSAPLRTNATISFARGETKRAIDIRHPEAWYFNPRFKADPREPQRVSQPIDIELAALGNETYKQTKIIPASFFARAKDAGAAEAWTDTTTDPVYPSFDGTVYDSSNNTTWSTKRSSSGNGTETSASYMRVSQIGMSSDAGNNWRDMFRNVLCFDISSIPAGFLVSSSTLSLDGSHPTGKADSGTGWTDNQRRAAVESYLGSCSLSTSDFPVANWGSTEYASIGYSSWSTGGYNHFTLNSSGNSYVQGAAGGTVKLGILAGVDFDNAEPSWTNSKDYYFFAYSSDQTGLTNDPKLVITYQIPALKVRKGTSQSSTTTTLVADNELLVGLGTSTTYIVDATVFVEASSTAPDLKIQFDAPSGSEVDLGYMAVGHASQGILSTGVSSYTIDLDANTPNVLRIGGTVKTSSTTAGVLQFKWAQATADSALVTVRKGSYIKAESL